MLVQRARSGDRDAFGRLYDRFHHSILHRFMACGASYEESWDLMQETFLHAWRGLHTLAAGTELQFGGWLSVIGRNILRKRWAKGRKNAAVSFSLVDFPDICDEGAGSPSAFDSGRRDYAALMRCLDSLATVLRQVVIFKAVLGHSYRNIGCSLDMAEATVRSRMSEALAALRECLEAAGVDF